MRTILNNHNCKIPSFFKLRTPTISRKIFNYKQVIKEIITKDWQFGNSNTCECKTSEFSHPYHKHILTGDLRFIKNNHLRDLLKKGPNYREPERVNWDINFKLIKEGILHLKQKWSA